MSSELKARVLLVDDEEDFLEMLSARLQTRGLKVNTVNCGEDAVAQVEEHNYDAIIVDLSMPGIDGLETIRRIKAISPSAEVIVLTGHGSVEKSVEALKIGAEDFLEKPVDMSTLMDKIGEAKDKRMIVLEKKSQEELKHILKSRAW